MPNHLKRRTAHGEGKTGSHPRVEATGHKNGPGRILGPCNYYRALVPDFAAASDSLYDTSKSKYVELKPELTAKFESLKELLLSANFVLTPQLDRNFVHETDASKVRVGAVLKQTFDYILEHPVGFFSKSLSGSERKYVVYELEMYEVVRATEHFRMLLLGREFLLRTDHAALAKLLRRDLPPTTKVER